jgi:hypothetical protein
MKRIVFIAIAFCIIGTLIGCAPGPNAFVHTANVGGSIAGFWLGFWQGIISPFTFIGSLFTSNVNFYEVHNNGGWYNFGFVLGAGILGSSASSSTRRRRRRRRR